ncbi:unnamed protein product [Oppiella nova]|uniref:Kynureninase n=1 Tax=Oppiella nova TaxID=334625 RepID=A0A7R9M6B4_9ACAR|nr:unnamed protein product [Oppiella nova]CAG2171465.1 unnamed protein product [Oppiella nova]
MESQMDIRVQSRIAMLSQTSTLGNKKFKTFKMNKPIKVFRSKSQLLKVPIDSPEFARHMDEEDRFASFRDQFVFPLKKDLPYECSQLGVRHSLVRLFDETEECLYLCGQSLGLEPKPLGKYVNQVLDNWAQKGVHSHFHGYLPAALSDLMPKAPMARIVGAKQHEVALMNALTVNLHLLLSTFYRPSQRRHKIIIEEHAFSSDMFVVKSQIRSHGLSPEDSLLCLKPRPNRPELVSADTVQVLNI